MPESARWLRPLRSASSVFIVGVSGPPRGKERGKFCREGPEKGTCSRGRAPACLSSCQRAQLFAEGLYCRCFVIFHIEDGIEFGDLKKIVNLLGKVEQLEFAALILCRGEGADEFADT